MTKAAFDAHYREHYRRILGLCRRMLGQAADAEDATQEVFMRGFKAFSSYRSSDPFGPWIGTISSNYVIDGLRRQRRANDIGQVIGPGGEHEHQFAVGADALVVGVQQEVADLFGPRGPARFAGD